MFYCNSVNLSLTEVVSIAVEHKNKQTDIVDLNRNLLKVPTGISFLRKKNWKVSQFHARISQQKLKSKLFCHEKLTVKNMSPQHCYYDSPLLFCFCYFIPDDTFGGIRMNGNNTADTASEHSFGGICRMNANNNDTPKWASQLLN